MPRASPIFLSLIPVKMSWKTSAPRGVNLSGFGLIPCSSKSRCSISILLCAPMDFLMFARCKYTISRSRDNSSAIAFRPSPFHHQINNLLLLPCQFVHCVFSMIGIWKTAEIANSISCSMEKIPGAVAKLYKLAFLFEKKDCKKAYNTFWAAFACER